VQLILVVLEDLKALRASLLMRTVHVPLRMAPLRVLEGDLISLAFNPKVVFLSPYNLNIYQRSHRAEIHYGLPPFIFYRNLPSACVASSLSALLLETGAKVLRSLALVTPSHAIIIMLGCSVQQLNRKNPKW
jgi:hypothetical protein